MSDGLNFSSFIDHSPDNRIWTPITEEEKDEYINQINETRRLLKFGDKLEKGNALEHLMTFIYSRFTCAKVVPNVVTTDNQIDHEITFIDGATPAFINSTGSLKIVGESKNKQTSISSREVTDLCELLRDRRSNLGIFSSSKGFSKGKALKNTMWKVGEGKRRKLFLSQNKVIIGFTLDELEKLADPSINFYTMIKQKYNSLIDEINDDDTDFEDESVSNFSYSNQLYQTIKTLYSNEILDKDSFDIAKDKIITKYGQIDEN